MRTCLQPLFLRLALALVPVARLSAGVDPTPAFLETCRVVGSLQHGNLAVVAVAGAAVGGLHLEGLDAALGKGRLRIRETGQGGTVNTLLLENHGDRPVFILAGEILAGAKQDRILQQDVVVPAGGKPVPVAAFCVEHGRWREQSAAFYSEKAAAPVAIRKAAQASKDQSVVWQEVASNNAALAVATPTGSLSGTYKQGRVVAARGSFLDALARLPRAFPSALGVVVLINGRVAGADLFGDPVLFAGLWPKLLDSVHRGSPAWRGRPGRRRDGRRAGCSAPAWPGWTSAPRRAWATSSTSRGLG